LTFSENELPPEAQGHDGLDAKILRSSGWVAISLGAKQLASILALLVLARLLEPKAFGLVSLSWAVLAFAEQIQESGIGSALIYRRGDVRAAAAAGMIWAPLASGVLYGLVVLVAPLIAHLLHSPELTTILQVQALVLLLRGLAVVPGAILERELNFRARAKSDVGSALAQFATSLALAFAGFGVWSLVFGVLAGAAAQTSIVWATVPWRPRLRDANRDVLVQLMRYGRFVGLGNVLNVVDNTIDNILVARLLGTGPLGYYSVAFRLASFPNSVIAYVVSRVMFPVYAMLQGDREALRRAYVQNLQRIAIVALPISVGLIVCARPIVLALLGEKWLVAVTPLRLLAVYGLIRSLTAPSGEVFKGIGKPYLGPLFSIPHIVLAIPLLYVLTRAYGLNGAALSILILMAGLGVPALLLALRQVGATVRELGAALAAPALCSALLAAALATLLRPAGSLSPAAALAVLVVAGAVVFVAAAAVFARGLLLPIWTALRQDRDARGDAPRFGDQPKQVRRRQRRDTGAGGGWARAARGLTILRQRHGPDREP
jgi:O-antigen/teichoic acid export membrane protein